MEKEFYLPRGQYHEQDLRVRLDIIIQRPKLYHAIIQYCDK